jgi:hypothetical protein
VLRAPFIEVPRAAVHELQPNQIAVLAQFTVAYLRLPFETFGVDVDLYAPRNRELQAEAEALRTDVLQQPEAGDPALLLVTPSDLNKVRCELPSTFSPLI